MELNCRRTGFFSFTYEIFDEDDEIVGQMEFRNPRNGRILVGRTPHSAERVASGRWRLRTEDDTGIAEAERLSKQPLCLRVDVGGRPWEVVTPPGLRQNVVTIRVEGETVGRVDKIPGMWSNRLRLTATRDLPLDACLFAEWLVGVHWVGTAGTVAAALAQR